MISEQFKQMIAQLLPDLAEQEEYFKYFQQPLKKSLSINRHLNPKFEHDYKEFLLSDTPFDEFVDTRYVDREDISLALGKTWQHLTGKFYIQEVAAALPANILKAYLQELSNLTHQPLKLLDMCAAPGGKTSQLASYLLSQGIGGFVRGNDVDTKRLATRASNIQRCGLYNTVATKLDGSQIGNLYPEFFDAILVDAPCSGEGTGFKSDAAYKWWKQESINKIVGLQEHILTSALKSCKAGGIVVYSTCTLNPFENEHQIKKILEKYGDSLEILSIDLHNKSSGIVTASEFASGQEHHMLRAWPHRHKTGGFFVCVIKKKQSTLKHTQEYITNQRLGSMKDQRINHKKATQPNFQYNAKLEQEIFKKLSQTYGITRDKQQYSLIQGKHKIYLAHPSVKELLEQGVRLHECGIPILKVSGSHYSLEHEFALTLGLYASNHTIELTQEQVQSYALGNDVALAASQLKTLASTASHSFFNNYSILLHGGYGIGVGKVIGNTIKNKFLKW